DRRLAWLDEVSLDNPRLRSPDGPYYGIEEIYRAYLSAGIRPKSVDETLLVSKDRGIANVVVFVASKDIPWSRPKSEEPGKVTIQLKDGRLVRRIVGMRVDQTLVFENSDPVTATLDIEGLRNQRTGLSARAKASRETTFRTHEPLPVPFTLQQWE